MSSSSPPTASEVDAAAELQLERLLDTNYRLILGMRENLKAVPSRAAENGPLMQEFRQNVAIYMSMLQELPRGTEMAPLPVKLNSLLMKGEE